MSIASMHSLDAQGVALQRDDISQQVQLRLPNAPKLQDVT